MIGIQQSIRIYNKQRFLTRHRCFSPVQWTNANAIHIGKATSRSRQNKKFHIVVSIYHHIWLANSDYYYYCFTFLNRNTEKFNLKICFRHFYIHYKYDSWPPLKSPMPAYLSIVGGKTFWMHECESESCILRNIEPCRMSMNHESCAFIYDLAKILYYKCDTYR